MLVFTEDIYEVNNCFQKLERLPYCRQNRIAPKTKRNGTKRNGKSVLCEMGKSVLCEMGKSVLCEIGNLYFAKFVFLSLAHRSC